MSDIMAFTTAATAAESQTDGIPFLFDGRKFLCYKPDEAQLAMLMASTGRGASDTDRIAGVINFFVKVMSDESASYFERRLLDRKDPFGIEDVDHVMRWMIEAWTGNPTPEPSGSTPSPPNTGPSSTLLTPVST